MSYFVDSDGSLKEVYFSPQLVVKGEDPSGRIDIAENGIYDVKGYAEAVVNVVGGGAPAPVLDSVFSNNDWPTIIWACRNNAVPETWLIGDEKTMQIGESEVVIAICGKNHDEYADGGIAPLTFVQKQAFMTAQIHSVPQSDTEFATLNNMPYTETDMYKTTLPSVIEKMPEGVKENLRAVKKKNVYIASRKAFFETADRVWLFSEGEMGGGWNNFADGTKYDGYSFGYCCDSNGGEVQFFLRSPSSNNYFTIYCTDAISGSGYCSDDDLTNNRPLIFGFCF